MCLSRNYLISFSKLIFLSILLILSSCSSNDDEITDNPEVIEDTDGEGSEETPAATIPTGTPALYLSYTEETDQFISGELIEGDAQTFLQFVPETGEANVIATNSSISFAKDTDRLETYDNKIYLFNVDDEQFLNTIRVYGEDLVATSFGFSTFDAQAVTKTNCAIPIGNDLYYLSLDLPEFGVGFPSRGPVFRAENYFSSVARNSGDVVYQELSQNDPFTSCFNGYDTSDGIWYDYSLDVDNNRFVTYTRDLATGIAAEVNVLSFDDPSNIPNISFFAFSNGFAYFVISDAITKEYNLLRVNALSPESQITTLASGIIEDPAFDEINILSVDADNDYVTFLISNSTGEVKRVALFEPFTNLVNLIDLGSVVQLGIIFKEN